MTIHYNCRMRKKDDAKRLRIFEVSLDVLLEFGFGGFSMGKVAKRANIAVGTIYLYFKNKDELISQLYIKLYRESVERFLEHYDSSLPFKDGLKTVWVNYLKHRIEHYKESHFLEFYYRSPYINESHKQMAEEMKKPVKDIIQRGKDLGLVRKDLDNEMIFLGMLGFIRELADEHVGNVYKLSDEKIDKAFEMSWNMIKL
ncbi:MAG: hypothetical protein PWR03_1338 [Tenuifilum sp.]|nr:hypothetical protein [Tenuifilum sp.]